jgi:hypothetical protein
VVLGGTEGQISSMPDAFKFITIAIVATPSNPTFQVTMLKKPILFGILLTMLKKQRQPPPPPPQKKSVFILFYYFGFKKIEGIIGKLIER